MFVQQSQEYIQQIGAEIQRLKQLLDQVRVTIQSEEQLESAQPEQQGDRKRAAKKSAVKKSGGREVPAKKRGRPKKIATTVAA